MFLYIYITVLSSVYTMSMYSTVYSNKWLNLLFNANSVSSRTNKKIQVIYSHCDLGHTLFTNTFAIWKNIVESFRPVHNWLRHCIAKRGRRSLDTLPLKRVCHEIFDPYFFPDSNPSRPMINRLKYFRIRFRFCQIFDF